MLKDCIGIFKQKFAEAGDALITDNYTLDPGTYILVDLQGQIIDQKDVIKNKFERIGFDDFIERDYLSKLLDMNKPIDGKKVIHSNNFLSFWIKKDNLLPDNKGSTKLNPDIINNYYAILSDPRLKYKGKSLEIYNTIETSIGTPDLQILEFCKTWITEHIFSFIDDPKIKFDKTYLKIFFMADLSLYRQESQRYFLPNIYNTTDYNILIDNQIFGLPNNNMGMNAKKPYLENKTRIKSKVPYLLSTDDVYMQKKFFDYLYNYANQGKTNVYFSTDCNDPDPIYPYESNRAHTKNLNGYFLRIQKGKELEIRDYDLITGYSPDLDQFTIRQAILLPKDARSDLTYGDSLNLKSVQQLINTTFFRKFLTTNYFTDASDIRLNDFRVKEELLRCRNGFFTWFYKGDARTIKNLFPKSSLELIKNSIGNGHFIKAIEQFNVRDGFITYFKGGTSMADQLVSIREGLREKINSTGDHSIESDLEYFYAVGQITNYYQSKSKSNQPVYSTVNPVINCKTDEKLKDLVKRLFLKYNYIIQPSRRFGNLQSMIFSYKPDGPIDSTTLIAGYLSQNLLYESSKETKIQEEKTNVK
ncbi:type I-B CRISPR-associated protein Cas8b/Csh1 [uncultured Acetobacterium sp.]|uniref:type I-B CRISPR-associated protein Cas8b/Csh1 n=1 Tax=uncultured Acetobacterium sp. TaxID=217139 RepID=UPI00260065DD|nr:type I-B CRISPR-associated protein Cas8b/Csh1 [uncultured Acetobacterium sp.]